MPETPGFIRAAEPTRTYRLVRLHCVASSACFVVQTRHVASRRDATRGTIVCTRAIAHICVYVREYARLRRSRDKSTRRLMELERRSPTTQRSRPCQVVPRRIWSRFVSCRILSFLFYRRREFYKGLEKLARLSSLSLRSHREFFEETQFFASDDQRRPWSHLQGFSLSLLLAFDPALPIFEGAAKIIFTNEPRWDTTVSFTRNCERPRR